MTSTTPRPSTAHTTRLPRPANLLGVVAMLVTTAACSGSSAKPSAAQPTVVGPVAGPATAPPPPAAEAGRQLPARGWDRPAGQAARVKLAGLDLLPAEDLTVHFHAHLDVLLDGQSVPVPAGLGISTTDAQGNIPGTHQAGMQGIAPLHTHDTSGVLHVESPTAPRFTLGQAFVEWNVALGPHRVGSYLARPGITIAAYVNGQPFTGDPASIVLESHQEIAIVITTNGASPAAPPSNYPWTNGL